MSKPWDQRVRQNGPEHIAMLRAGQLAANKRRQAGEGFIYVAELLDYDGVVKIGHSLNPQRRVKAIKVIRGDRLRARLLAFTPGTFTEEHSLHRSLADMRHADFPHCAECYPRSVLSHPAIPAALRARAA